jgi:hypothetical protein
MTIFALQKTFIKEDGGVYTDAYHKVTGAELRSLGTNEQITLRVRLSTYKDGYVAADDGPAAEHAFYNIDVSEPAVAMAFDALRDAIYASIKAQNADLSDATDITAP